MKNSNTQNKTTKILVAGVAIAGLASNSFALTAADFDVTTAVADMGFAAVAVISLSVLALGYAFVKRVL